MKIVITVFGGDEENDMFGRASAFSFERALEELVALQKYVEERIKREKDTPIPF
jgi:hypothetical protein